MSFLFLTGVSFVLPLYGSQWMLGRLLNVSLALAIPFLLLSVTHEGLFLLALTVNLFTWLAIENSTSTVGDKQVRLGFMPFLATGLTHVVQLGIGLHIIKSNNSVFTGV